MHSRLGTVQTRPPTLLPLPSSLTTQCVHALPACLPACLPAACPAHLSPTMQSVRPLICLYRS